MPDPITRSGDLRHRITIQSLTNSQDSVGDITETWTTVGTFWGFVRPASAREQVIAGQLKAEVYHSVTMRWQGATAISPTMRILFEGKVLNIVSISNRDSRNYLYDLTCTEVVS